MCLAIPAKVVEVKDENSAWIEVAGIRKEISITLVDHVMPGDYLIVHVGYAIGRIDPAEAEKTLATLKMMDEEDARLFVSAST